MTVAEKIKIISKKTEQNKGQYDLQKLLRIQPKGLDIKDQTKCMNLMKK